MELTVVEGDSVKKGQLLARVYADILATQRDQAAAGVNQQEAQVSNSTASLEAFKARMEQAERQYKWQLSQKSVLNFKKHNQSPQVNLQAVETTQFTHIGTCKKARKQ